MKAKTMHIGGLEIPIVSDAEAEASAALVCVPVTSPLLWPGNLTGPCSKCGEMVQWHPSSPSKPPRFCMSCGGIALKSDSTHVHATAEQARMIEQRKRRE